MRKPCSWASGRGSASTAKIFARGGASATSRDVKRSTAAAAPSTSMNTPSVSFPTWPASPISQARRWTKGRNPTPWTTPTTRIRLRNGDPGVVRAVMP